MIRLKPGVKLTAFSPQILLAIYIADGIYRSYGQKECWVTSVSDGKHGPVTFHYIGYAVDLRTRDMSSDTQKLVCNEIATALGSDYDVVLESDHIHCEFDPR